jgi:hypothetical protein
MFHNGAGKGGGKSCAAALSQFRNKEEIFRE